MPAAITIESSYAAMSRDMGSSHIKAHAGQHKYLMDGEDPVDYLLPNDEVTPIVDQAIQAGVRTGQLRSIEEWKEYNQGIRRKDRRLNSYKDYIRKTYSSASKKVYRDIEKALKNAKTPKAKRSLLGTAFTALAAHEDLPIVGSLLYFGDANELEMAKQEGCFEQLKAADTEAGNLFVKSRAFQCLHSQAFKLERHKDENGRPHLQMMEACFSTHTRSYKTKKGAVTKRIDGYGKTQYQLDGLIKYFGSQEAVNTQLDRLIELQQKSQDKINKNGGKRVGLERPEAPMLMDDFNKQEAKRLSNKITQEVRPKSLERMRRQNIAQLARIVDFSAMAKAKAEAYKQAKLPSKYYQTNIYYQTDGKHLTADQYRMKMAIQDKGAVTIDKAKSTAKQTKKSAQEEAEITIKSAHKQANSLIKQAKSKKEAADQAVAGALYNQSKINHQTHVAQRHLASLNKQIIDEKEKFKQQKQKHLLVSQNEQKKYDKLVKENKELTDNIKKNEAIVKSINGLKRQAKSENLNINEVVSDRSKLINKIRLIGKAYAVMEKTAKLAVALMLGTQIRPHESKKLPSERAFGAGITLENYENPFTTSSEKKSMVNFPILLVQRAGHWLENQFKIKFGHAPFENEKKSNINPKISPKKPEEHMPE